MATTIDDTRLCRDCLRVKPISEFRRRYRGESTRLHRCRSCHNESERIRRVERRVERNNDTIAKFVTQLKNAQTPKQVELLCGAMIQRFGGVEELFAAWVQQFEAARVAQPGSKKVLDFYQAILRMIEYCDANRPNLAEVSDHDLEDEIIEGCKQLIRQHPEVAIDAAEQIGWTVIPELLTGAGYGQ